MNKEDKMVQLCFTLLDNINDKEMLWKFTQYMASSKIASDDLTSIIDTIPTVESDLDVRFERLFSQESLKPILKSMITKDKDTRILMIETYRRLLMYTITRKIN